METNNEPMELFSPSGCLTEQALRSFSMNSLDEVEREKVLKHLSDCEFCNMALEGINLFISKKGELALAQTLQNLRTELDDNAETQLKKESDSLPPRKTRIIFMAMSVAATVVLIVGLYLVIQMFLSDGLHKKQLAVNKEKTTFDEYYSGNKMMRPPPADSTSSHDNNPWVMRRFTSPVVTMDSASESDNVSDDSKYLNKLALTDEDFKPEEKQASGGNVKDEKNIRSQPKLEKNYGYKSLGYSSAVPGSVQTLESKTIQHYRSKNAVTPSTELASKAAEPYQKDLPGETPIFSVVEEMPTYPGGENARLKFLNNNLHYPDSAKLAGISGTVYVSFVIDEKGKVGNIMVKKGIGGGCDEEAIKVVKKMPRWIPGRQAGVAVNVQFTMPIRFSLN